MNPVRNISSKVSACKKVTALAMIFLLVLLTCINQFIYSAPDSAVTIGWNCDEEEPGPCLPNGPAGPDEKSPDAPVTINEEYIHEHHAPVNPYWSNALFEHMIHEADKLRVVHFEILSPPPNV